MRRQICERECNNLRGCRRRFYVYEAVNDYPSRFPLIGYCLSAAWQSDNNFGK